MTRLIYIVAVIVYLTSCGQGGQKKHANTIATDTANISTTISTDTSLLGQIIDIRTFKPISAKFKYTFIDNSGQDKRLSTPGPSDYLLEGVLYFDTTTFKDFKTKYLNSDDFRSPDFEKQDFDFEWLDKNVRDELINSDVNPHGHTEYFFDLGYSGKLRLLNNKVLLTKSTN